MAKIEKIKKGTATIYPVTIPQAVIDPTSGKSAREELDEKANHGYDSAPKTLKAVDEAKVDKTSIVGETGQGETTVMHQKAVTDKLALKASHGYESNPKTLKEVDNEKAAHGYGAEPQKTLKQVDDEVIQLAGEVSDSTEKAGAASLSELNARLLALEKIVSATITNKLEVTKEFNVWGKTNLILTGSGAATFAPDFIGQKYIDTTGGNIYVAVGVATAGNWKLV